MFMKKSTFRNSLIFTSTIFIITIFMSVGFSAVSKELSISSNVTSLQMGLLVNNGNDSYADFAYFLRCNSSGHTIMSHNVRRLYFRSTVPDAYQAGTTGHVSCDVSAAQNGSVMAYYVPTSGKTYGDVYVVPNNGIAFTNTHTVFASMDQCTVVNFGIYINTSKQTDMSDMFLDLCNTCNAVTDSVLNLSAFNTSNVTSMLQMFMGMHKFEQINLSSFNTSNVTTMACMFDDAIHLKQLNLSTFNTSNVTSMWSMFDTTSSLEHIYIGDGSLWNVSNVTTGAEMFEYSQVVISSGCPIEAGAHVDGLQYAFAGTRVINGHTVTGCLSYGP